MIADDAKTGTVRVGMHTLHRIEEQTIQYEHVWRCEKCHQKAYDSNFFREMECAEDRSRNDTGGA